MPGRAPAEPLVVPVGDLLEQAARAAPPATTPLTLKSVRRDGVKKTESDIATSVGLARRWALSMTGNQRCVVLFAMLTGRLPRRLRCRHRDCVRPPSCGLAWGQRSRD